MIEVNGVTKSFGKNQVLKNIDLSIKEGEFFCLLGPSGCGKTTLLRTVAGLEPVESGSLKIGSTEVTDLPPHKRGCAMVFQNYALWPHLTVGENITYGLEVQKKARPEIERILEEKLKTYHLEGLQERLPHQLSGGQQQRVALARAMAMNPKALLMDEPLSNLDAALRKSLRRDLLEFHRTSGSTVLYVTHDQEEALALADRMAIMMDGKILELGKPKDLYLHPQNLETALFLGDMNVFPGPAGLKILEAMNYRESDLRFPKGPDSVLCIRPENVLVETEEAGKTLGAHLSGILAFTEFTGSHFTLGIDTDFGRILARVPANWHEPILPGLKVKVDLPLENQLWY